jgi:hypothetical protein
VIAERDRRRRVTRCPNGRGDRERRARQRRHEKKLVREREGCHQRAVGAEVEARGQHGSVVRGLVALHAPPARGAEQSVHRQPIGVQAHRRRARIDDDLAVRQPEAPAGEPGCPRVQQRDAQGLALGGVGAQPASLTQQFLPTVAQRASDHPRIGDEGRLDAAALGRRERQCPGARRPRAGRSSGTRQSDDRVAGLRPRGPTAVGDVQRAGSGDHEERDVAARRRIAVRTPVDRVPDEARAGFEASPGSAAVRSSPPRIPPRPAACAAVSSRGRRCRRSPRHDTEDLLRAGHLGLRELEPEGRGRWPPRRCHVVPSRPRKRALARQAGARCRERHGQRTDHDGHGGDDHERLGQRGVGVRGRPRKPR